MAFEIKQNNRRPHYRIELTQKGQPVDLTGVVAVRFTMKRGLITKVNRKPMTIIGPNADGVVEYAWAAGDTDTVGSYGAEIELDWGGSPTEYETFPSSGSFPINVTSMAAALLDLNAYKALLGVTDTRNDDRISALLGPVSRAISTFVGRDFELRTGIATPRTFMFDDSGILDIDDCIGVASVTLNFPNSTTYTLDPTEWTAMPLNADSPVFYYLMMTAGPYIFGTSPEMGFTRNLDKYPAYRFAPPTVTVVADWGWDEVPGDVQLATALTIQGLVEGGSAEGLTSEAIDGFARSWGGRGGAIAPALTIPNRARDLLANYQRIYV